MSIKTIIIERLSYLNCFQQQQVFRSTKISFSVSNIEKQYESLKLIELFQKVHLADQLKKKNIVGQKIQTLILTKLQNHQTKFSNTCNKFALTNNIKYFTLIWNARTSQYLLKKSRSLKNYQFPQKQSKLQCIVYKAKDIIRQNLDIVQLIANQQLSKEQLDEFLSQQEVLVIQEEIKNKTYDSIQGLCCLEGKRVYIHEWIVKQINFKRGIDDDNDIKQEISFGSEQKSFHFNHKRRAQYIIEYTMMENISRYFDKNRNLRSISPERNPNLRIYKNKMVGSGKFFLKKVHNRKVRNPNPLELNTQRYYVSSFINIQ